jgi:D-xylose transport system substrate-binding protein
MRLKLLIFLALAVFISACVQGPQTATNDAAQTNRAVDPNKRVKIGFAMDTVKEERWQRDQDAFKAHCAKMNVECVVTVANNSADRQSNDVENLLTQGVDVLVIAPHDATQAASMVDKAKARGIPVISYDRLINSDEIDLYISHQVPVIGRKIAEYALANAPEGDYVMVYGAGTDNNAVIMKKEQLTVLQPALDSKKINIVAQNFMPDWKPEEALKMAENALTQYADIKAFVVSNDGMAGGVVSALEKRGLAGKILVTGQDAQKDALQRIAQGTQTMTVYKPIVALANGAVEAAIKLAKKESLTGATAFRNDTLGKDVPAILLEVTVVDKNNLIDTVIKDGYVSYDDVYANVPADKRPPQK